jgi:hypothetical protein
MSPSLNRIRNLVTEIEEIHRHGQQGRIGVALRAENQKAEAAAVFVMPEKVVEPVKNVEPLKAMEAIKIEEETIDPFAELASVVHLDQHRESLREPVKPAKVFMTLSGAIALSLQIEDTGETVELKQNGNQLEIRFADGKAFHLPLKAMA